MKFRQTSNSVFKRCLTYAGLILSETIDKRGMSSSASERGGNACCCLEGDVN